MSLELKFMVKDLERIKSMMRKFEPDYVENKLEHYEYFLDKKQVRHVLKDANGRLTYIEAFGPTGDGKMAHFKERPVKSWNRMLSNLRKKYRYEMTFTKETTEYRIRDIKVRFCLVEGLEAFIEIDSIDGNKNRLLEFMNNFGLTEKELEPRPYHEIIRERKTKKTRLSQRGLS